MYFQSHNHSNKGFTIIELAIVLIVIGLIMGLGLLSWKMLYEARQAAKTQSTLRQVKSCLLQRMTYTLQYPTYSNDLTEDNCTPDIEKAVDYCLCQSNARDAWGGRIRFIEGFDAVDNSLAGQFAIDRPYHKGSGIPENATDPYSGSSVKLDTGTQTMVAFVLLSLGRDGKFDDTSYEACFDQNNKLVGLMKDDVCTPDFSNREDDQILIVGGPEIRSRLSD